MKFASSRLALPTLAWIALAPAALLATDLTWDAGGSSPASPTGGGGTWSSTNLNWSNGSSDLGWTTATDNALFTAGSGGTITLGENITVNDITFGGSSAYNIGSGSFTLTVNGTITVNRSNTVSSAVAGTDLTKAGTSTLGLAHSNTYTGDTIISAGSLQPRATGALPTSTRVVIGTGSSNATLDVRTSQTVAGISNGGTGTDTISQTQTTGITTLTIDPDGAGGAAADSTYSGTITESGSGKILALTKAGSHTLTLTGTNSYTGATTVSGGTLKLGSSLAGSSSVTVSGGTLSGNDSVAAIALGTGAVSMSSGAIAAGGAGTAGSFTLASGQNFSATGGTLDFDLGSSSDQILGAGSGMFSLADTTLALNTTAGFSYGGTYTLFSSFSGGSVSNLSITGYDTANYLATLGTDGVLSFATTSIPEPSTAALMIGAAVLGLALRRRKAA